MSDTQGAQDTASGGLENDMPSIGNAPPAPRMVPSAFGGLTQLAMRALGGQPAPRAPGPGRSPWQSPGQSQIPPAPGGDRWQGTTGSIALPKGSPQPRAAFTPYMGTLPTEDHRQWGQPEEYPNLPEAHELPGLYSRIGQAYGQQGGLAGPLGMLINRHSAAYMKGVMQGQEFRAKMERERLLMNALKLQEQQEQQHTTYSNRMQEYFEVAGENKAKAGTVLIKGVNLRDALAQDAMKLGDDDFLTMIQSGVSFEGLMRYQAHRDALLKDLQKTNQKAQEQSDEDKLWNEGQGGTQQTDPNNPFAPQGTAQPEQGSAAPETPSGAPAPTMMATNVNDPFNPDAPTPEATPVQQETPDTQALSPQHAAALQGARGYELDPKMAPMHRQQALRDAAALKGQVEAIIANKRGGDVMNAVRAIPNYGPAIASELEGVSSYRQAIGGQTGISTGGRQGEWYGPDGIISRLAQAYNPKWNQAYYHDRDVFRNSVQNRTIMLRTGDLAAAAQSIIDDRKAIEQRDHIDPTKVNWQGILKRAETDYRYQRLSADILSYMDAYNTITSGGRHTETGATKQASLLPSYTTLAAITNVLKGHMRSVGGIRQGLHDQWEGIGGKPDDMPYDNPKTNKTIDDIMQSDPISGAYPGEVITRNGVKLRYTGRNQIDPNARENWEAP